MSSIFYDPNDPPQEYRKKNPAACGAPPAGQTGEEESDGEGEGKGKQGGNPALTPNPSLFDPKSALYDSKARNCAVHGQISQPHQDSEAFGAWSLDKATLCARHAERNKSLNVESLDTPGKMMKVIVALSVQGNWDTENLVKALDRASRIRFEKDLYHLVSLMHDNCSLDWKTGEILRAEPHRNDHAPR